MRTTEKHVTSTTIRHTEVEHEGVTMTVSTILNGRGFVETMVFGDGIGTGHLIGLTGGTERIHEQHEQGISFCKARLTTKIGQNVECLECEKIASHADADGWMLLTDYEGNENGNLGICGPCQVTS